MNRKVFSYVCLCLLGVLSFSFLSCTELKKNFGQEGEWAAETVDELYTSDAESGQKPNKQKSISATKEIEIPIYESSRGGQVIRHTGYMLSYDADYKTPQWVAWTLTARQAQGTAPRYDKFQADPKVRGAKAYPSDYTRSGYDRGHMAPAGDMKWSETAMQESFYMTNVAVPDAFFKVLLVNYPKSPKAYGFIFKNEAGNRPLTYYQLTVDEVEQQTGMDFFSSLPDKIENRIEKELPAVK